VQVGLIKRSWKMLVETKKDALAPKFRQKNPTRGQWRRQKRPSGPISPNVNFLLTISLDIKDQENNIILAARSHVLML